MAPFVALLLLGSLAFWIWMLIDCLRYEPPDSLDKLVWVLVILLASVVGAVIYLFVRKLPRDA